MYFLFQISGFRFFTTFKVSTTRAFVRFAELIVCDVLVRNRLFLCARYFQWRMEEKEEGSGVQKLPLAAP